MSGIARLLKWLPCLWAISRLASNSAQAPRSQILNGQSGPPHPTGSSDLFNSLNFTTRTVVRQSHAPSPSKASRSPRLRPTDAVPQASQATALQRRFPDFLRHSKPQVHIGWRWEHPPFWPVVKALEMLQRVSKVLSFISSPPFGNKPRLPERQELSILASVARAARNPRESAIAEARLVSRSWNSALRTAFWSTHYLALRPKMAYWSLIAERLQVLIRHSDVIIKVKLNSGPTDILPISQDEAVRLCPELAKISRTHIREIKVEQLDTMNEVLLKQILYFRQERIRHFAFRAQDTVLFTGRRSIFYGSNLKLPNLRKITIDISGSAATLSSDGLFGDIAGPVSYFVAELVGREDREGRKDVEVLLYCMPSYQSSTQPQIAGHHMMLAARIFESIRSFLDQVRGIKLVASFQGPISVQATHNRHVLRSWANENDIQLLDANNVYTVD